MMEKNQFSYVGKIVKTFGYKGELMAHIEDSFCKKIEKTEFVFVDIQHERVPFFIVSAENQNKNIFLIRLEDIDDQETAQQFSGSGLYIYEPIKNKKAKNTELKDLVGFEVVDHKFGIVGKIEQILELPQQFIMQIFKDKKEILIPFNEDIVKDIDAKHQTINIKAPDGLIDFYME